MLQLLNVADASDQVVSLLKEDVGNFQQPPDAIVARGKAALTRLHRNCWPDWIDVIRALEEGQRRALHDASTNNPKSYRCREMFGSWLRVHGFDQIDRADRSRLLKYSKDLSAMNVWRENQPPERQLDLNHPRVVFAAWKRSIAPSRARDSEAEKEANFEEQVRKFIALLTVDQLLEFIPETIRIGLEDRLLAQLTAGESKKSKFSLMLNKLFYRALREKDQVKRAENFEFLVKKIHGSGRPLEHFAVKELKRRSQRAIGDRAVATGG